MRLSRLLFGCSSLAISVVACAAAESDPAQVESDHTAGEYIQRNDLLYWNDSSFEEFRRVSEAGRWQTNPQPAGADDVAQKWLQHWSDRIDAIVREKVEQDTGSALVAPKPLMHLLPSSSISNAWVTAVPACTPWQVRAKLEAPADLPDAGGEGAAPDAGASDAGDAGAPAQIEPPSTLVFDHYSKRVSKLSTTGEEGAKAPACIPRPDFAAEQDKFLASWNEGVPSCPAERAADGAIEVPASCVTGVTEATQAALYAISPHVQFASDLLAAGSEAGAVFVVAHELAHFYRAHGSPLARHKYGFWYDQDPKKARRPVAAKDGEELKKLYAEVLAIPAANQLVLPGATYTPRYRAVVVGGVCSYLRDRSTPTEGAAALSESCQAAAASCKSVSSFSYSKTATPEQLEAYLQLEKSLEECGASETLGSVKDAPVAKLIGALQSKGYLPAGAAETVPVPESFGALLGQLQQKANDFDAQVARFAERLRVGRIGLYTTEQEADELALEWVNLLGFSTKDAIEGWLSYLQYFEKWGPPHGEPSAKECSEKFSADFKDGNKFSTVFLGDLNSAHHAGCYRVYNLWREQRAHRYEPAALVRPEMAWDDVLAHARTLSSQSF